MAAMAIPVAATVDYDDYDCSTPMATIIMLLTIMVLTIATVTSILITMIFIILSDAIPCVTPQLLSQGMDHRGIVEILSTRLQGTKGLLYRHTFIQLPICLRQQSCVTAVA